MKNIIRKWLGIDTLEQHVDYVSNESSVAFNRATYALTAVLEEIASKATNTIKPAVKKSVKKITKINKTNKK